MICSPHLVSASHPALGSGPLASQVDQPSLGKNQSRRGARGEREIRPHVSDDRKPARVLMLFFLTCPVITFNN